MDRERVQLVARAVQPIALQYLPCHLHTWSGDGLDQHDTKTIRYGRPQHYVFRTFHVKREKINLRVRTKAVLCEEIFEWLARNLNS
jgi:hypothetical protein